MLTGLFLLALVPSLLGSEENAEEEALRKTYRQLLDGVGPEDTLRRFQVGTWCLERGLYPQMFEQFDLVLRREPGHARLRRVLQKLRGRLVLQGATRDASEAERAEGWIAVAAGKSPAKALLARWELEEISPETRAEALIGALKKPRPEVRVYAAEALSVIREPKAVPHLIAAFRQASSGSGGGTRAYAFFGRQIAYVRDFDVQIAQAAAIAKPVVGILQTGSVIDVRILGVTEEITVGFERKVLRASLSRFAGRDLGPDPAKWEAWWRAQASSPSTGNPK